MKARILVVFEVPVTDGTDPVAAECLADQALNAFRESSAHDTLSDMGVVLTRCRPSDLRDFNDVLFLEECNTGGRSPCFAPALTD